MKSGKNAETLVSLIVGMSLLSITIFGIFEIFQYNQFINYKQNKNIKKNLLEQNTHNILKSIDMNSIPNGNKFYLIKDKSLKTYKYTSDENFKQINSFGEPINAGSFKRTIIKKPALDIIENSNYTKNSPNYTLIIE